MPHGVEHRHVFWIVHLFPVRLDHFRNPALHRIAGEPIRVFYRPSRTWTELSQIFNREKLANVQSPRKALSIVFGCGRLAFFSSRCIHFQAGRGRLHLRLCRIFSSHEPAQTTARCIRQFRTGSHVSWRGLDSGRESNNRRFSLVHILWRRG